MDIKSARTLTLIAGILFVIQLLGTIGVALFTWLWLPQLLALITPTLDPATLALLTTILTWLQTFLPLVALAATIPQAIVAFLTLSWRHHPEDHKTGLIVIGILGIIGLGVLPGIFALVAGLLIEDK